MNTVATAATVAGGCAALKGKTGKLASAESVADGAVKAEEIVSKGKVLDKVDDITKGAGKSGKKSLDIVKETEMFTDYINEAGTVIRIPKQTQSSISDSISKNLKSTDIGVSTEAKVADFISKNTDSVITDFGNKVKTTNGSIMGDIDVATENTLIEVKASIASVKEKQLYKYVDNNKNTYINTGNKEVILYIDETIDLSNPNNINLIEKIENMGITVVNDINQLKGVVN